MVQGLSKALTGAISRFVIDTYESGDWISLAIETDSLDAVTGHPRLLKSLSWNDSDYQEHAALMIPRLLSAAGVAPGNPAHLTRLAELFPELFSFLSQQHPRQMARLLELNIQYPPRWRMVIEDRESTGTAEVPEGVVVVRDRGVSPPEVPNLRQSESGKHQLSSGRDIPPKEEAEMVLEDGTPSEYADTVFVVHGRNKAAFVAMEKFLSFCRIRVLSWSDAKRLAIGPNPTTFSIVKAGLDHAGGILVLFTPDEIAHLKQEYRKPGDSDDEFRPSGQARPNVLLEAGMALGLAPDRTIFVRSDSVRRISDIDGLNWITMNGSWDDRSELIDALCKAGLPAKPLHLNLMHDLSGSFDARSSATEIPKSMTPFVSPENAVESRGISRNPVAPSDVPRREPARMAGNAGGIDELVLGDRVRHRTFGVGVVRSVEGRQDRQVVKVEFAEHGMKRLLVKFAGLEIH